MAIKVRQGATLVLSCVHKVAGVASSIVGMTITSHVRNYQNTDVDELTYAAVDENAGTFKLTATAAQTALWPTGPLYWDIRLESPGSVVQLTSKEEFQVSRPVTLP